MTQRRIILLVDDDADLRGMFRIVLTLAGFEVREAADGYEALVMLEDGTTTDLIVLDLRMPRVDGLDVLADLRARNENVPIVVVSAYPPDLPDLPVECILKKPVTPEQLIATVTECLAKRTRTATKGTSRWPCGQCRWPRSHTSLASTFERCV